MHSKHIHKARRNITITDTVDFMPAHSVGVKQQGKAANGLFGLQAIKSPSRKRRKFDLDDEQYKSIINIYRM